MNTQEAAQEADLARYTLACCQLDGGAEGASHMVARGSRDYWRINLALFLAGFSTFSLIYCVQPLLPLFAELFAQTPAQSALLVSLTTGFLAVSLLGAGIAADVWGRKWLMFASMCTAALLHLCAAFAQRWEILLLIRALEGIAIAGVPAVAMAYLAEEIEPRSLGLAMGLYVGSTAFGGMSGRLGAGVLVELMSWREVLGVIGLLGVAAAIGFALLLPPSRNFKRRPSAKRNYHLLAWRTHLSHPYLPLLFLVAFLVMGAFVTGYNYIGFRLLAAPYSLSHYQLGMVFIVYLFGIVASPLAGSLADRFGRPVVLIAALLTTCLGLGVTMCSELPTIIAGIAIITIGFFAAHGVASGWVGRAARSAKGYATALYLLAYYLGSSLMGSLGGWFWHRGGWPAVSIFIASLLGLALLIALYLLRFRALAASRT